jgi:hypothetical protein
MPVITHRGDGKEKKTKPEFRRNFEASQSPSPGGKPAYNS